MKRITPILALMLIFVTHLAGQKVGIGTTTPVTTLNLIGAGGNPSIPGSSSTGMFRLGLNAIEAIDFGKMVESPFSGWIQAGYNGIATDPLSLQPMGGNVGIGTINPITKLHVDVGPSFFDGFIIEGESSASGTVPNLGDGSRMMYFPAKAAFRAGVIDAGTYWDDVNVGRHSVAMGFNTTSSGVGSVALGEWAYAYGPASIAMGNGPLSGGFGSAAFGVYTNAIGSGSFAAGNNTEARGAQSTAMGLSSIAHGSNSAALGYATNSKGFSSTVIGMFNDSMLIVNETVVTPTTPLFIVGNGNSNAPGQRTNAMVVRKDGRVGIGSNAPATILTLIGPAGNPSIPNTTSTGIFRIGLNPSEGIDFGKMTEAPFSGWVQAGISGSVADPLSLQPSGGSVAIGTATPASSAKLDVSSTNRGFLPPRMTMANRNSISSPVAGLTIWCNNCGIRGQLQVYDGTMWTNMTGSPALGLPAPGVYDGGGIIAYILQAGDPGYVAGEVHGLIVTVNVQSEGAPWGCSGINIPGAAGTALGTGNQNTIDIVSGCSTDDIAARICSNLVSGGYSDWYLPSKDELNKLYLNHAIIGGFSSGYYWSSSEFSSTDAWTQYFIIGGAQSVQSKSSGCNVRAVRSF